MFKKIVSGFAVLPIIILGLLAFVTFRETSGKILAKDIVDQGNKFQLLSHPGWKETKKVKNAYISLITIDNLSTAIFSVYPKYGYELFVKETSQADCKKSLKTFSGENMVFEETKLNNSSGYKCSFERLNSKTNGNYQLQRYELVNDSDKNFGYMITVNYPKDSVAEKERVEQLLNNFSAL